MTAITEALAGGGRSFSFEFFPPKNDADVDGLLETAEALSEFDPTFVSVTYGAAGTTRDRSLETVLRIRRSLSLNVMAHLTCEGSARVDLVDYAQRLQDAGVRNVLALRGDRPHETAPTYVPDAGLTHASDLIELLAPRFGFCIGAACYPEVHTEARDAASDMRHLASKVNAGAKFLITQLFFDNARYFAFVARARAAGITVPIIPGIMPITNANQVKRFTALCGATLPARLRHEIDRFAADPAAVADIGIAYATLQCANLLAHGAPGIHFYTLNKAAAARAVLATLRAEAALFAA
jgi:methylenetetrahydrofolate reductase (NADPH)